MNDGHLPPRTADIVVLGAGKMTHRLQLAERGPENVIVPEKITSANGRSSAVDISPLRPTRFAGGFLSKRNTSTKTTRFWGATLQLLDRPGELRGDD